MRVAGILWKSLVVGRVVASARSTDAGGRSLSPTRRHPTEAGLRATPAWPRAPKPSRWDDQRPRSWSPRLGEAPSPRRARSRSAAEPGETRLSRLCHFRRNFHRILYPTVNGQPG